MKRSELNLKVGDEVVFLRNSGDREDAMVDKLDGFDPDFRVHILGPSVMHYISATGISNVGLGKVIEVNGTKP
jgi:hypothetical protein